MQPVVKDSSFFSSFFHKINNKCKELAEKLTQKITKDKYLYVCCQKMKNVIGIKLHRTVRCLFLVQKTNNIVPFMLYQINYITLRRHFIAQTLKISHNHRPPPPLKSVLLQDCRRLSTWCKKSMHRLLPYTPTLFVKGLLQLSAQVRKPYKKQAPA